MKRFIIISLAALMARVSFGQQKPEVQAYIDKYKDIALEEMVRSHIPASITLAQGILESGSGKSSLATKANNHFGIKCKDEWDGKKFYQTDDAPNECFRVYDNAADSYRDHSDFLTSRSRYAFLFKLNITDYKAWAYGLKEAGYATHPKYASMLLAYIDQYNLADYDRIGVAMMQKQNVPATTAPVTTPTPTTQPTATAKPAVEKPATENAAPAMSPTAVNLQTPPSTSNATFANNEFKINGLKVVKAVGNVDPFSIAYNYNIDYDNLLAYNDMVRGDNFKDGDVIYLQAKKNHGSDDTYTVKPGESMWYVAQRTGIKIQSLYEKNQMQMNDQAQAGEVLYLQRKRPVAPRTISYAQYLAYKTNLDNSSSSLPTLHPQNNNSNYQVQPKDTLYSIARRFNTTVDTLKRINNLDSDYLKAGQLLVVRN